MIFKKGKVFKCTLTYNCFIECLTLFLLPQQIYFLKSCSSEKGKCYIHSCQHLSICESWCEYLCTWIRTWEGCLWPGNHLVRKQMALQQQGAHDVSSWDHSGVLSEQCLSQALNILCSLGEKYVHINEFFSISASLSWTVSLHQLICKVSHVFYIFSQVPVRLGATNIANSMCGIFVEN